MNMHTDISHDDVQKYSAIARELRAQLWSGWAYAVAKAVASVARITVTAAADVIENTRRARRRQATIRALSGLSDHVLRDIGLSRDRICSVAIELSASPRPARPETSVSDAPSLDVTKNSLRA